MAEPRIVRRSDVVGEKCGVLNERGIRVVCQWFYDAVQKGEMSPDRKRGGWVWSGIPKRYMSDATYCAVYIERKDYHHKNHTGEAFLLADNCPDCQGQLPFVSQEKKIDCGNSD